jgi:hypothetical protein
MDYSNLTAEVKEFFIKDYSEKALELRGKAANPRARKGLAFTAAAVELEEIVAAIKAA